MIGVGVSATDLPEEQLDSLLRPLVARVSTPWAAQCRENLELAFARVIIEAHDGKIRAGRDGAGGGIAFAIALPAGTTPGSRAR